MSAQCDVKKEKVCKKYPAFGDKLFSIASRNLPHGVEKDKNSVVTFFRKQSALSFDTSSTYAWLNGNISGTKPLVADNFKRILLFYIGKDGLNTLEEIHEWIALGPEKYEAVLNSDEVQAVLHTRKILHHVIDQGEELAERQKLWARLTQLIRTASQRAPSSSLEDNLIAIQGPPGVGKTMLLDRLRSDPAIQACFDEIFYARCNPQISPQTFLDFWFRKLLPDIDWQPGHVMVMKDELQKALQGRRLMLLADNLSSPADLDALRPLCELGCLLIVTTRCLEVSRQVNYSNVIELTAYSKSDVMEYYSKNYASQPSIVTQERLFDLAEMVRYNPLGLNIALRRVAEEGWEPVMQKVQLAPSTCLQDVFKDLHKPFWLAYSSLSIDDQEKFCSLGLLPTLASYDEDRLGKFWGVSKARANEYLVRLEKEAGLVRRCSQEMDSWYFHPQVLNYARCLLGENSLHIRMRFRFYPSRVALQEMRPCHFHHMYKRGVKFEVWRTYWQMIRKEGRRRRSPIILGELRRLIDPTYSTDWSIFSQLTPNCTLKEYAWGYRTYLEGGLDILFFVIYLALIGIIGGLQSFAQQWGLLKGIPFLLGILNLFLLTSAFIWAFHIVLRDLRRRYDWAQLWQKVCAARNGDENT